MGRLITVAMIHLNPVQKTSVSAPEPDEPANVPPTVHHYVYVFFNVGGFNAVLLFKDDPFWLLKNLHSPYPLPGSCLKNKSSTS